MDGGLSGIGGYGVQWPQPGMQPGSIQPGQFTPEGGKLGGAGATGPVSFDNVLTRFVDGVDQTQKSAEMETRKVLLGQTDNLHQAMLAGEESKLALTLLVEVRNKLVEGFQEVMRMQV